MCSSQEYEQQQCNYPFFYFYFFMFFSLKCHQPTHIGSQDNSMSTDPFTKLLVDKS